jgi:hypothetical protein
MTGSKTPLLLLLTGLCATGALLPQATAAPNLHTPEGLPVSLNWRKWQQTAEGWELSAQVSRSGAPLAKGAHLHLKGHPAGETILVLPVGTLNRSAITTTRVGSNRRHFEGGKARVEVPFAASTESVEVAYCEEAGHTAGR